MPDQTLYDLYAKAMQAHAAGDYLKAQSYGREIEKIIPDDPRAWIVLAQSALGLRDFTEAAKYLTALHEKEPENLGFRQQLTEIYRRVGYFEEAVGMFRPVFEKSQEVLEKYTYFGHLCSLGGAEKEALKCFQKADKLSPNNPDIKTAQAKINIALGDLKAAEKCILAALKINPGHIEALGLKGDVLKNLTAGERKTLAGLLNNPDGHLGQRVDAGFTLGKALNQETDYSATFQVFKKANDLAGKLFGDQGAQYGPFDERAFFKKATELYSPDMVAEFSHQKALHPTPIFIIGLPRSGTTLVEQVLSSHQDIGAGGEMKLLGEFHLRLETLALENPNLAMAEILKKVADPWRQEYLNLLTNGRSLRQDHG
ncbi:MAG: tetratricopeptide repeat protein [Sphingomonadales bacterium]